MEFMTGVAQKETLELSEICKEGMIGKQVKVNGAVHTAQKRGTFAVCV